MQIFPSSCSRQCKICGKNLSAWSVCSLQTLLAHTSDGSFFPKLHVFFLIYCAICPKYLVWMTLCQVSNTSKNHYPQFQFSKWGYTYHMGTSLQTERGINFNHHSSDRYLAIHCSLFQLPALKFPAASGCTLCTEHSSSCMGRPRCPHHLDTAKIKLKGHETLLKY